MKSGILSEQNLWLKLIILVIAFVLGIDATLRQQLLLIGLFTIYYLLEYPIFGKVLLALRRLLPFLATYWLFATLFGTDFPEMVFFSLQVLFFLFVSVYCLGTTDLKHFMLDTGRMQNLNFFHQFTYVILATGLFIRGYFELLQQNKVEAGSSIGSVVGHFTQIMKENFARAKAVEAEVEMNIRDESGHHNFFVYQNLIAIVFLTLIVVIGSF